MPHIVNSVPRGCPNCNNEQLGLFKLTVSCLRCGWCRVLIPKGEKKRR